MSDPRVGIILVNWNGYDDTAACLQSLRAQRYPNANIYLVDNGSQNNEGQRLAAAFPEVALLLNRENLGFTGGNNAGIRRALQDGAAYVLLLNNDTVVDPDFLVHLVAFLASRPAAGIAGSKILYHDTRTIWFAGGYLQYWTGFARHMAKGMPDAQYTRRAAFDVPFVTGCCLLVRREVIERIGPLHDAYFAYFEDVDWCFAARQAGWSSWVVPTSILWHKKGGSGATRGTNRLSPTQAYYQARNAFIFARRQLRGFRKWIFIVAQCVVRLPMNLLYCMDSAARRSYLRGFHEGFSSSPSSGSDIPPLHTSR
ncbi:MAG: glycosyltransferase family 2 protein [Candidatus Kerfeldbacteria bacterium]|nr:glycosyltransferase family 2 protein [Candidatus Kerfeldbacteria bacterium]